MTQTPQSRDQWALRGAVARLKEIKDEIRGILDEFPELRGSARGLSVALPDVASGGLKKRRTMSPEARKRMSAGMRKFWARRKAAAKSGGKTKGASA